MPPHSGRFASVPGPYLDTRSFPARRRPTLTKQSPSAAACRSYLRRRLASRARNLNSPRRISPKLPQGGPCAQPAPRRSPALVPAPRPSAAPSLIYIRKLFVAGTPPATAKQHRLSLCFSDFGIVSNRSTRSSCLSATWLFTPVQRSGPDLAVLMVNPRRRVPAFSAFVGVV